IVPGGTIPKPCHSDQAFTIVPADCHSIADVVVDGVSLGALTTYTFTDIVASHTIAASFALVTYTITASADTGGTLAPEGAVSVDCGADQAFGITPDGCHSIADVVVDGGSVGAVASYTFA